YMYTPDAGTFDNAKCESDCVDDKSRMRAANAPVYEPAPSVPVSRVLYPFTLLLVFVGGLSLVVWGLRRKREQEWSSLARRTADASFVEQRRFKTVNDALAFIGSADTGFSRVLFEDFLYALYAEAHAARGGAQLARLGGYLGERARE